MEPAVTGVLDAATLALIENGMSQLAATVTQVIGVTVPAVITVICLSAGVNYALRKVHSVIGHAQ